MSNQSRQPKGIPVGGQYAASAHAESGISLGAEASDDVEAQGPDYSTWTPVEVDTELARLHGAEDVAMSRYASTMDHLSHDVARSILGRTGFRATATYPEVEEAVADIVARRDAGESLVYPATSILSTFERAEAYRAEAQGYAEEAEPFHEEFQNRGGWPRAFLVTNVNGHVHSSMNCSTCFQTGYDNSGNYRQGTRYAWMTDYSGKSEAEIVKAAGSDACTTCYKSAPTEDLARPRSMFTPEEKDKAKEREERAQAKIARDKAKIEKGLTADGSEFKVEWTEVRGGHERDPETGQGIYVTRPRPNSERFKTERAAVQWLVQELAYNKSRPDHLADTVEARQGAYESIIKAVAAKHGQSLDEVRADIDKKVTAKRKRDGYED